MLWVYVCVRGPRRTHACKTGKPHCFRENAFLMCSWRWWARLELHFFSILQCFVRRTWWLSVLLLYSIFFVWPIWAQFCLKSNIQKCFGKCHHAWSAYRIQSHHGSIFSARGDRNFTNSFSNTENLALHLWRLSPDTLNNLPNVSCNAISPC